MGPNYAATVAAVALGFQPSSSLRATTRRSSGPGIQSLAVMSCSSGPAVEVTESMTLAQYDAAYDSIASRYNSLSTECDATHCQQADWAGCVLRAAGHDFMDFADGTGGADGCMNLNDPDNNGLHECLYRGEFNHSIHDAYEDHCTTVSLADFLVIAAEAVMTLSRQHVLDGNPAAPSIDFRSSFKYGRRTAASCPWSDGRLPNPENSCTAVQTTFVEGMGLTWSQSAALMGVHTVGRADPGNSGYDGFWSDAMNSRRFNNDYFYSIINKGWRPENVNPGKNQWHRSDSGADDVKKGKEMMLNTDLCLVFTKNKAEELSAAFELSDAGHNCCAWRFATNDVTNPPKSNYYIEGDEHCGATEFPHHIGMDFLKQKEICCANSRVRDCTDTMNLYGPAYEAVKTFAYDEAAWLTEFMTAWQIATSNGFSDLKPLA